VAYNDPLCLQRITAAKLSLTGEEHSTNEFHPIQQKNAWAWLVIVGSLVSRPFYDRI
jgi:hypothetical protein